MLNDKHIDQWAGYLLEELPNFKDLIQDDGLAKVLIEMYKKGFNDCLDDNKIREIFLKEEKRKILQYIAEKAIEKHKNALEDMFDNGYFWAMKDIQSFILKELNWN